MRAAGYAGGGAGPDSVISVHVPSGDEPGAAWASRRPGYCRQLVLGLEGPDAIKIVSGECETEQHCGLDESHPLQVVPEGDPLIEGGVM